ncbi:MAG: putative RNA methyltransferase [Mycobacteriaceae bacterium]
MALDAIVDLLTCPVCHLGMTVTSEVLVCPQRHSFDVARQGYVNLLSGSATGLSSDTADMIAARDRFLTTGHFDSFIESVSSATTLGKWVEKSVVLEMGAGTGHYLNSALQSLRTHDAEVRAIAVDLSKAAARKLAQLDKQWGVVVADAWARFPMRESSISVALSVFAPRNIGELARVLTHDGILVVLTPNSTHLTEIVDLLDLVRVDQSKAQRLEKSLSTHFTCINQNHIEYKMPLSPNNIKDIVAMGPSARHQSAEREVAIAQLPEVFEVTASATISVFQLKPALAGL